VQPLEREGRTRAVPHEPLDPRAIGTLDTDRGIHAEATGRLPVEHVGHRRVVQDLAAPEGAEHTPLHGPRDLVRVFVRELRGLVEAHLVGRLLAEDAIDGEDVVVEVRVQAGPEALRKGDGRDAAVSRCTRASALELGADPAHEDAEHDAREPGIVVQVGAQTLGDRQHPLT